MTTNFTPAQLRRIADILESNDDQPGFDFASAVAAMEAEDLQADPLVRYPLTATCEVCGEDLQFDIDPDGTPGRNGDWGANGDYGCFADPADPDEGTYGHTPTDIEWHENDDEKEAARSRYAEECG